MITDQITDQDTPYCDELSYAVCNKNRVLAQIRCLSREYNPSPGHHKTSQIYDFYVFIRLSNIISTFLSTFILPIAALCARAEPPIMCDLQHKLLNARNVLNLENSCRLAVLLSTST